MFNKIKENRMQRKMKKIREKKIALILLALFALVIVLACIIGSANEKDKTDSSTNDYILTTSDSTFKDNSDTEQSESKNLEPVKLETIDNEISLEVGEKYDYASFYNYTADVDLKAIKLEAVSGNETVAKVEIKEINEDEVTLIISGISKGETSVIVKSNDGTITSEIIHVVIGYEDDFGDEDYEYEEDTIKLVPDEDEITIRVKEKNTDCSLYIDDWFVDLSDYKFEAYSIDENVAKVKIEDIGSQKITLLITGVSPGETDISVMSDDGEIISDDVHVTVKKASKAEASKTTTEREVVTTEERTTDEEERTVYITPSGSCYHTEYCRYLKGNGSAITLREAKSRGLRACKVCSPWFAWIY